MSMRIRVVENTETARCHEVAFSEGSAAQAAPEEIICGRIKDHGGLVGFDSPAFGPRPARI
jgi:hypothetical protein